MKRLYGNGVIEIIPVDDGFVFAVQQSAYDDKIVVAYKLYSFDTGACAPIKKSVYIGAKFGADIDILKLEIQNYLQSFAVKLPKRQTLILGEAGNAFVVDESGEKIKSALFLHNGEGATSAVLHHDAIWCGFSQNGVIVKYDIDTLKEDIRISGGPKIDFGGVGSLTSADDSLLVCGGDAMKIYSINTNNFDVQEFLKFDEPVMSYTKINGNELVLLPSGIYIML